MHVMYVYFLCIYICLFLVYATLVVRMQLHTITDMHVCMYVCMYMPLHTSKIYNNIFNTITWALTSQHICARTSQRISMQTILNYNMCAYTYILYTIQIHTYIHTYMDAQSGDLYTWKDIKDAISDCANLPERVVSGVHTTDVLDLVYLPPNMAVSCSVIVFICIFLLVYVLACVCVFVCV